MLPLHPHGRRVSRAIKEDKCKDFMYFHILIGNRPITSMCSFSSSLLYGFFYFLMSCLSVHAPFQITWGHTCTRNKTWFWGRNMFATVPLKLHISSLSVPPSSWPACPWTSALPVSSLLPWLCGTNWKTSVIILVLAQIWWDQRWPAGRGREQMVACSGGPGKGPSGFNTSSPLGAWVGEMGVGGIRLGEPTWAQWHGRRASTAPTPCLAHIWRQPWSAENKA